MPPLAKSHPVDRAGIGRLDRCCKADASSSVNVFVAEK
jgi:hypothetical protein